MENLLTFSLYICVVCYLDVHSRDRRSYNMSRIRASRTKPELLLKEVLQGTYLRYQPHVSGRPDFASTKHMLAVFVDGCFWHGCPKCYQEPEQNKKFWREKKERNKERDREVTGKLKRSGWAIIRIWEHEIKKDPRKAAEQIRKVLKKQFMPRPQASL